MILDEIGARLDALSEFTLATNLFLGTMPSTPDTLLTVYEYPGLQPVQGMGSSEPEGEQPRINLMSRSMQYQTARNLIQVAWNDLVKVIETDFSGISITLEAIQSPFLAGSDENGRVKISANFQVTRSFV